ncbi:MAG TPA: sulfite exporter TauE/SafE family protein [Cyclobacteriaceae bacterium]|nr:sulfite exporter TauE/SafE family protein [Cyclobacteriaceae bacterium]
MSEIIIIAAASLITSLLTFFSGFGLGTILMPVFAIFFPVEIAIAMTGVVHFLNNTFKLILTGGQANLQTALRFGIPAFISALAGSYLLLTVSRLTPVLSYHLGEKEFSITMVKIIIAVLLILFSLLEIIPYFRNLQFERKYLLLGGVLSGFFGGLSGHQGALRSAFLIKSGLDKNAFIATGIAIAFMVDISRLSVYSTRFVDSEIYENFPVITAATLSAFLGAFLGNLLLKKITFRGVQMFVSIMLIVLAVAIGIGIV